MKIPLSLAAVLACAAISPAAGQDTANAVPASPSELRDADAIAAIERMGRALAALKAFSVSADITDEQVLTTGQKLQSSGTLQIAARRPDGMKMDITSDRETRTLYYDGKTLTVFAPKVGYYASVPAPATIKETIDLATERYDIEFPLADLFVWGGDGSSTAALTSAFRVGTEKFGGVACEHYAARQEGTDWQVWIAPAPSSLPCKLVITTTDDPSQPQYSAVLKWKADQALDPKLFTFSPPSNTRKITLGTVEPQAAR